MIGAVIVEDAGWIPYPQPYATVLALLLGVLACSFVYLGRSKRVIIGLKGVQLNTVTKCFIVIVWGLSIVTLLTFYSLIQFFTQTETLFPDSPITPITLISAIATFTIITYLTRSYGLKVALGNAFVGMAAAPMLFELPFNLLISPRTETPLLLSFLFLSPMFLVEFTTLSLLLLSPLVRVTEVTMYSFAAMLAVFAIWAFFGFSFPSDLLSFTWNSISKVLAFVTAITLFR